MSNISNPKIAIFYFAFLPQFVLPGATHPTLSMLVIAGLTFIIKDPGGFFAGWLRSHLSVLSWLNRSSGAILIGLGVKLAFERRT
ncbi:MAG: LysE family transporter [Deltaproteobacteria bacterium]|nr:LysE family transporter [Deltaproteobacteria bacterium]